MNVETPSAPVTQGLHLSKRQLAMLEMMGVKHVWPIQKATSSTAAVVQPQAPVPETVAAPEPQTATLLKTPSTPQASAWVQTTESHQPSQSLEALTLAVSSCQRCPMGSQRVWATLGEGQVGSGWMFVLGSAPVANGGDFSLLKGPAQQLLLAMTRALGLQQQPHWITTVSKCAAPSLPAPGVEDMRACVPHLNDQIELVKPKVLVVMGTGAAQAMGLAQSQEPLGKLRNQRHEFAGVPVVVTYPPEFLLRHPQEKARVWEDLCLAASWVDAPTMTA
jgi:DNA polymerase